MFAYKGKIYDTDHSAQFARFGRVGGLETEIERSMYSLTGDVLQRWKTENEVEIFEKQFFADLPEAAAEGEAGPGRKKKSSERPAIFLVA